MATTELVKRQLPSEVAYTDQANTFTEDTIVGGWSEPAPKFFDVATDTTSAGVYAEETNASVNVFGQNASGSLLAYINDSGNADNDEKVVLNVSNALAAEYRTANTAPHIFKVNGTERARINSSGMDVTGDFTVNGSPISGSGISKEEAIAYAIALG